MMLVDIGVAGGTATVMVAADGTVSFYSSSGGGVLGLGEHEHIREAAFALLRMADAHKDLFPPVSSASDALLPGAERVRFTLRLPQGYRSVEAALAELGEAHPLSPLFTAVNGLIVEISETPEAKASIGQGP